VDSGPFDLVLAADVLYERPTVATMLALLPRLAPAALLADPSRPTAAVFLEQARARAWQTESVTRGVVDIHRLRYLR
jgi:predicted nicotinamide N-methyase